MANSSLFTNLSTIVRRGAFSAAALTLLAGAPAAFGQYTQPGAKGTSPATGQAAPLAQAGGENPIDGTVSVDDNMLVELHVADEDLNTVLQMLSIQSQRNIVASRNVSATVTANLYGVTFTEALDAILHVNGYGYLERGNFIYVYTLEELQAIEQASRVRVVKVIKLNYLNAVDAAEFVTPLLSEGGQIKTNGKTGSWSVPSDAPAGADDYANDSTLMVYDYQENVDEIEKLVGQMDTKPAQVLVESTILQTQLNEANAFGIDFSIISDLNFTDFLAGPLSGPDGLFDGNVDPNGSAFTQNVGKFETGSSTFKAGIVMDDVAIFLRLLDQVSDTQILSRPKILALNRQPARVLVGRKVGYLSTTSTDTSTTQTVEFLDTGTQLYLRPFVSSDGLIRMELKPQVSEAVIREQTDATGAAVTIPDEITNELVTNVMVRDGQTIVLGGLFRESTTAERRQVPFVGDLPIVGAAFRGHDDETKRDEIIFMITPTIVNDQMLVDQGERSMEYVDHVRTGARQGLLPFSREKQSSQLIVEAERLYSEGKTEEAIHKLDRAERLNRQAPDIVALRQKISGHDQYWPDRSILQDVVDNELNDTLNRMRSQHQSMAPAPKPKSVSAKPAPATNNASSTPTPTEPSDDWSSADEPSEPTAFAPTDDWSDEGFSDQNDSGFADDGFGEGEPESFNWNAPAGPDVTGGEFTVTYEPFDGQDFFGVWAQDASTASVLGELSSQSGVVISCSEDVVGTVNVDVHGLSFDQALDMVVGNAGYSYYTSVDGQVHVAPAEQVAELIEQDWESDKANAGNFPVQPKDGSWNADQTVAADFVQPWSTGTTAQAPSADAENRVNSANSVFSAAWGMFRLFDASGDSTPAFTSVPTEQDDE